MGLLQITFKSKMIQYQSTFLIFNALDISGQPQGIALEIEAIPLNDPSADWSAKFICLIYADYPTKTLLMFLNDWLNPILVRLLLGWLCFQVRGVCRLRLGCESPFFWTVVLYQKWLRGGR